MTDQASNAETNDVSLTMEEILSGKKAPEPTSPQIQDQTADNEEKTKAEDNPEENKPEDGEDKKEEVKTDPELEKLRKRLEDTQKWGNTQRQATLKTIKGLQEKGLSDDEIAEIVGGKEVLEKVVKGVPIDQEIDNPIAVVNQTFNSQIASVEAAMKELGHTDEELKEYMEAFNTLAFKSLEHRDEMYRRATSGEGNVAAYALKVGKELVEDYRLSRQIESKGVKAYEQELRERIKAELAEEAKKAKEQVAEELGKSSGKPRLVGGASSTPETKPNEYKSLKDILG